MTAGLITRDSSNRITADMTKALSQSVGFVTTNREDGSASISMPAGKNYFFIISALEDSQRTAGKRPGVTLTKDTISWNYLLPSGFALNCRIYYGYY